jgi:hypothetical protein
VATHEPETVLHDIEDAGGVGMTGELTLASQDSIDELFLTGGSSFHLEVATDGLKLVDGHPAEVGDVEVPAVAILEIVVLGHRRTAGWASARAAIA